MGNRHPLGRAFGKYWLIFLAGPLMRRVVRIFLQFNRATGHEHPHLGTAVVRFPV